ncbi:hypothetical protein PHYSODRAFT_470948, partial [Phytophthora sojae]
KPLMEQLWTPNFMATTATLDREEVYLFNIYAPTAVPLSEKFYESLAQITISAGTPIFVGGDFNCTQNGVQDRSYEPTANSHSSEAFATLVKRWRLHDSLGNALPDPTDPTALARFRDEQHTHRCTVHGGKPATSRLDRWYANDLARPWMTATQVDQDGLHSDHKGVLLHLRSPSNPLRIHKERRVFPVPAYAQKRADDAVLAELAALRRTLDTGALTALQSAELWDAAKHRIAIALLNATKAARRSKKNTYRKKIKRLYRQFD